MPSRRDLLLGGGAAAAGLCGGGAWWLHRARPRPPNVVLILTDDQGYNDLGCYWTPEPGGSMVRPPTPRLDALAAEGLRLTDFYVAAAVCTPSRAALLTGCYPPRIGFGDASFGAGDTLGVLTPSDREGLHPDEVTLAEILREVGYRTACIGKWHLGHRPGLLPTVQGFDDFFGVPYSHNQRPLPLLRDSEVIRRLPDEPVLTGQFTQAAVTFLERAHPQPFFLYLAHTGPHWPWRRPTEVDGRSARASYRQEVERLDWSTGEILDALDRLGLTENTLVIFTSDNGPWLHPTLDAGSAYPFRGGKAESWEGGFRTPCVLRWPGVLPAGQTSPALVTALDILPTVAALAGAAKPSRPIDGVDLWTTLRDGTPSPREDFVYYARGRLEAIRMGRFKRVFDNPMRTPPVSAALYDLVADPGEGTDVSEHHPDVVARLEGRASALRAELGDVLTGTVGSSTRPLGQG